MRQAVKLVWQKPKLVGQPPNQLNRKLHPCPHLSHPYLAPTHPQSASGRRHRMHGSPGGSRDLRSVSSGASRDRAGRAAAAARAVLGRLVVAMAGVGKHVRIQEPPLNPHRSLRGLYSEQVGPAGLPEADVTSAGRRRRRCGRQSEGRWLHGAQCCLPVS